MNDVHTTATATIKMQTETLVIHLSLLLPFAGAVVILMLIPGPNVALIIANSVSYGQRYGMLTVAGTASAMVVQLGVTALGMTEVLGRMGEWLEWLRWVGVVYLIWLGIVQWRAPVADLTRTRPDPKSARAIFLRALLVSLTNPKVLLFYGAFFPQFVDTSRDVGPQVAILSATFLGLALVIDTGWASAASRARFVLARHGRLRNRISGGLLMGAGTALAFARAK